MKQKKKNQTTHQPTDIAVIGMSCWYPGAQNLLQFWENILGKRQQFRRMLDGRLPIADYHNPNRQAPDKTYGDKAAFLEGFEFDWMSEKFPKSTYDSTDLVHWLALDLAGKAIHDAGMTRKSIPLNKTGVIVGNSLTGESSRSNGMRLRWPYIQKVLAITAQNRPVFVAIGAQPRPERRTNQRFHQIDGRALQISFRADHRRHFGRKLGEHHCRSHLQLF